MEVSGTVERIIFSSGSFCIAKVSLDQASLKLVSGQIDPSNVRILSTVKIEAGDVFTSPVTVEKNPRGNQLRASPLLKVRAAQKQRAGILEYLEANINGIGSAKAQKIYEKWGDDTLNIISAEPQRLSEFGFSPAAIEKVKASFEASGFARKMSLLTNGASLGAGTTKKLINKFGGEEKAYNAITENPYKLTMLERVGFKRADEMALASGFNPASELRIAAGLDSVFDDFRNNGGHTAPARSDVLKNAEKLLGIGVPPISAVLDDSIKRGRLVERDLGRGKCVSRASDVRAEAAIAEHLKRLLDAAKPLELNASIEVMASALKDDTQEKAVLESVKNGVMVVTGRPGCGKTTTTKTIVAALKAASKSSMRVRAMAPTGKAAQRLAEALGTQASTIHSALGSDETGEGFRYDEDEPMDGDLFIVDEASMMDNYLASKCLGAIPSGARLLIVGDHEQIAPVGAGAFLGDVIESGLVPVVKLQTIHRTAAGSDILTNAHAIISGDSRRVNLGGNKDFVFRGVNADSADENIVAIVKDRYRDLLKTFAPEDIAILTARHKTGSGTEVLNREIRAMINPVGEEALGYRVGDRVMNTKNQKFGGIAVMNGEVGDVVSIKKDTDQKNEEVTVKFDSGIVTYGWRTRFSLTLAYAMTMHKSQGSEYPVVMVISAPSHTFSLNQNLIYTAITRGRKHVEVIGSERHFKMAIVKPGADRDTGLVEEIKKLSPAAPAARAATQARKAFS